MSLDLSDVAVELLKELGGEVFYIIREGVRPVDPDTGLPTGPKPSPTRTQVAGALVDFTVEQLQSSNIQSGDGMLLLDPTADYQQGDIIELYDGTLWTVVDPDEDNHAGIRQLWKLHIRSQ